ncbi:MAG: hypothetical protein ACJ8E2_12420 [Bradyrhizobium sp.]
MSKPKSGEQFAFAQADSTHNTMGLSRHAASDRPGDPDLLEGETHETIRAVIIGKPERSDFTRSQMSTMDDRTCIRILEESALAIMLVMNFGLLPHFKQRAEISQSRLAPLSTLSLSRANWSRRRRSV